MKVTVFGATGDQGRAQVKALAAAGHRPLAVSRKASQPQGLAGPVATFAADFSAPDSLARAVDGSDAVFLNLPSTTFQKAEPLIAAAEAIARAARRTGVSLLVFNTSLPVPKDRLGFAAQDARHEMRARIFGAGLPAIIVQPVVFLDNLMKPWAWPRIAHDNVICYAHSETLDVSWICHDDLAALMIAALERPQLAGSVFDVGGPDTVRGPELARRLGAAWNRPLRFESQSIDDFCARMRETNASNLAAEQMIGELGRIYHWYNEAPEHPFVVDMTSVLSHLPVRLSSIEEWARRQEPLPAGPIGGNESRG
jgi:uncharacterized protein YbjT (DUF2867 family)